MISVHLQDKDGDITAARICQGISLVGMYYRKSSNRCYADVCNRNFHFDWHANLVSLPHCHVRKY